MPKSTKTHKKQGHRVGKNQSSTIKLTGRYLRAATAAATLDAFYLSPLLLDARLVSLSDGYQEYRFNKVYLRSWAQTAGNEQAITLGLAYSPGLLTTAPATLTELQNLEDVGYGNGMVGAPFPSLNLGRQQLMGPANVKWFRRGTTFDDTVEIQGLVSLVSSTAYNTRPAYVLVEYEVELRASADTALTAQKPYNSADPIQDLEAKVCDIQLALGIAPRVPNPAKREFPADAQQQEVKQAAVPALPPGYVLVPRGAVKQDRL